MKNAEIRTEGLSEDYPNTPQEIQADIQRRIELLERDEQLASISLITTISLIAAKYGFAAVSATLSGISGTAATVAGGASVVFGAKHLLNSIRNKKTVYEVRDTK